MHLLEHALEVSELRQQIVRVLNKHADCWKQMRSRPRLAVETGTESRCEPNAPSRIIQTACMYLSESVTVLSWQGQQDPRW